MPKELVWTDDLVTRYWAYYAKFPHAYFSYRAGHSVVRTAAPYVPKGARVLDFGCGPGFMLGHMLDAGWDAAGCDMTHEAIGDYARSLSGRPGFAGLHTTSELMAKGQRYDAIFLCEVIEHLDDGALQSVLNAVHTLLAPGGKFIVTTPNDEDLSENMIYCPLSDVTFHRWQHMRSWSDKSLSACLSEHGLKPVTVKTLRFRDVADPAALDLLRRALRLIRRQSHLPNLFAVAQKI